MATDWSLRANRTLSWRRKLPRWLYIKLCREANPTRMTHDPKPARTLKASRRRGMTLIELIFASALTTTLITATAILLRGSYSAWQAHSGDYLKIEAAQATLRHIVRQVRQATAVS